MKFDSGRLELLYSHLLAHPFPFSYLTEIAILYTAFEKRPFTMAEYEEAIAAVQEQIGAAALQLANDYMRRSKATGSESTCHQLLLVAADYGDLFYRLYEYGLDTPSRVGFYLPNLVSFNVLSQVGEQFLLSSEEVLVTLRKVFA